MFAAVVIALIDVSTGEITAVRPLVVAVFGGFVVYTVWKRVFIDGEA